MKILVVAATAEEVMPLISDFGCSISDFDGPICQLPTTNCQLLVTGVGMVATAFALGRHLVANKYDLVVNLGIAGSFDKGIALGEVIEITGDTFAELGAEDDTTFLSIEKMGFGQDTYFPSTKLSNLYNLFNTFNLKTATAITVNTVHGNEASIRKVTERLHPQLESMEGAAFFYACHQMNVPCIQIRAVSNYVEKRNRDHWEIGLAIKNLNTFALEFLKLYA
ncbi:MAG TPA: futalosine hydrolase [Mucilaginibacter sp.]|jgi:futalosine hydrolase|nr:futalosine hydrolase [Mucilaginibacter sp.]